MFEFRKMMLATASVVIASAVTMAGASAADPGVTDDEIVIGSFGPMSGNVYMYGKLMMNGVDAVFKQVNDAGGVHGRKLKLVRQDDFCKPEGAIGAIKKLAYDEQVFAILGGACSTATLAAKPEILRSGVPTVINVAVADGISHPPEPNIFTITTTAALESKAQLQYAIDSGARKIGVVAQHDAWGRERYGPLMEAMKSKGVTPVADEEVADDTNDATPQVLRLMNAGVDSVIMLARPKSGAVLIRDAVKVGFKPKWIAQTAIQDLVAFKKQVGIPGALEEFVTISSVLYQPSDPEMDDWRNRIQTLFPNDELSPFSLNGIAGAEVLVEVLKRAGPDLTREKFLATMSTIKDFKTGIYAGPISCHPPQSHQCLRGMAWVKEIDGKVRTIEVTVLE